MLLGKLSPVATKTYQINAFQTETITGEYMTVKAETYVIGVPKIEFELRFGNLQYDENGVANHFDIIMRDRIFLSVTEDLADWGTDDEILLHKIAEKLGTTITEVVTVDLHHHY
jgi:hypothetical protein